MGNVNKATFERMIEEDLYYLRSQRPTLERDHIECLLEDSINKYFPDASHNQHGLKNNEIAEIINAVTMRLHRKLPNMPQCLREMVSGAVMENLEGNGLRLDATKS